MNDLTDERIQQLIEYANSFRTGGVGEQMLAERLKEVLQELKRSRAAKVKP